jgi:agmatinase
MEFSSGKNLYVSVDMDVIDPAFAPSVAYPESCGLTSRDFLYIIKRINRMKNLRLIDIVGINETKDMELGKITLKLGAKIVSELV